MIFKAKFIEALCIHGLNTKVIDNRIKIEYTYCNAFIDSDDTTLHFKAIGDDVVTYNFYVNIYEMHRVYIF